MNTTTVTDESNKAVQIATNALDAYQTFKKTADTIQTIVTANPVALAIRGIFLIAMLIGMAALKSYLNSLLAKQAEYMTEAQRKELATYIARLELNTNDGTFDQQNNL